MSDQMWVLFRIILEANKIAIDYLVAQVFCSVVCLIHGLISTLLANSFASKSQYRYDLTLFKIHICKFSTL